MCVYGEGGVGGWGGEGGRGGRVARQGSTRLPLRQPLRPPPNTLLSAHFPRGEQPTRRCVVTVSDACGEATCGAQLSIIVGHERRAAGEELGGLLRRQLGQRGVCGYGDHARQHKRFGEHVLHSLQRAGLLNVSAAGRGEGRRVRHRDGDHGLLARPLARSVGYQRQYGSTRRRATVLDVSRPATHPIEASIGEA